VKKRRIIDSLMGQLEIFLAEWDWKAGFRQVPTGQPNTQNPACANSSLRPKAPRGDNSGSKRRTEDTTNDDEEDASQPRVKRVRGSLTDTTAPLFACPYFKSNPQRYQRCRTCCGPGWSTVHRLK
jgi:hypothetical protein